MAAFVCPGGVVCLVDAEAVWSAEMYDWWTPERVEQMRKALTGLAEGGDALVQSWLARRMPRIRKLGWRKFLAEENTTGLFSWREVCRRAQMTVPPSPLWQRETTRIGD